jgi:hypothetical protein
MYRQLLIALVLTALFLPAVALAEQVNIAQALGAPSFAITPYGSGCPIGSVSPCETFTSNSPITFQFDLTDPYDPALKFENLSAQMNWSAASTSLATDFGGGVFMEYGFNGDFQITQGTTNLLSGNFVGALLVINGLTATLTDSGPASTLSFTSDYFSFKPDTTFALTLGVTLANPETGQNNFLSGDTGWGTVTFSSSPPPVFSPEPATMFLGGGALIGLGALLRKRKFRPVL